MAASSRLRALAAALVLLVCAAQTHLARCARPEGHRPLLRGQSRASGLPAGRRVLQQDTSGFVSTPVQLQWFFGAPETISHIGQGETVQWVWWDDLEHSVQGTGTAARVFSGPGGGTNLIAQQGFTYNFTFTDPGTFSYHCHKHLDVMLGQVVVKAKENPGGVTIPWYDGVSYGGASAVIEEGDTVVWDWTDDLTHSLLSATGDATLFPGPGGNGQGVTQSDFKYKKTFTKQGEFLYLCAQHGDTMKGNITVVAKGSLTSPSGSPPSPTGGGGSPAPPTPPTGPVSNNVSVNCTRGNSWKEGGVEHVQYDCTIANTLPVPIVDLQLSCVGLNVTDAWNIDTNCSLSSSTLSAGQVFSFGFHTTNSSPPKITVLSYTAAEPNITVTPPTTPSSPLSLNCSSDKEPWLSGGQVVYQFDCTVHNSGTAAVSHVDLSCTNFKPTQWWNILDNCSLPLTFLGPGGDWPFGFQTQESSCSIGIDTFTIDETH